MGLEHVHKREYRSTSVWNSICFLDSAGIKLSHLMRILLSGYHQHHNCAGWKVSYRNITPYGYWYATKAMTNICRCFE